MLVPAAASAQSSATVRVDAVDLDGNSAFTDERLTALFADEIGARMNLQQLREIADAIEQFYHREGYRLVRVVVPEQRFADGRPVKMNVLKGRLASIEVENAQRYRVARVRKTLHNAGLRIDQLFRLSDIERALTLLNRHQAGIETSASLSPGGRRGYTTLTINVDSIYDRRLVVAVGA